MKLYQRDIDRQALLRLFLASMASTPAKATINSLPEEMLEKIAQHIEYLLECFECEDQRPTLRSFSLVCKNWLRVSRRVARAVNVVVTIVLG